MVQNDLAARQIWYKSTRPTIPPSVTRPQETAALTQAPTICTTALPAGGTLNFNDTYSTVLDAAIIFEFNCKNAGLHDCQNTGNSTIVKLNDPFYASVPPQIYALATATIVSYMLVILVFITQKTFYVGGPGGGSGFLGLRTIVPRGGSSNVIGVGRRPLLQKIAAVTVAISLTIATADTFMVAERQYNEGLMDSQRLVEEVVGSTEIRVVQVVSDTFLWLAQVQTLIRLFPRHREKVTIKWLGFALVTLDTIFSILENFVSHSTLTRPRSLQDAIPALSYLFQMAISLIYASCVIYYSLSKRRFAFWHSKMKNICLVAMLSLAAVLVPVVFFVLDVSQPNIATWGEYIQWVGAAAASVVVWEWVERIETLERDERKEGILGREIFDGDEMLDSNSDHKSGSSSNIFGFRKRSVSEDNKKVSMISMSHIRPRMPFHRKKANQHGENVDKDVIVNGGTTVGNVITRPPQAATPISRSDTTSAASTVYAVRYQNMSSPSPAIPEEQAEDDQQTQSPAVQVNGQAVANLQEDAAEVSDMAGSATTDDQKDASTRDLPPRHKQVWHAVANPFKRKRAEPPAEVAAQMVASNARRSPAVHYQNLRDRFNAFGKDAAQKARIGGKQRQGPSPPLQVTVIPAQPRPPRLSVPGVNGRSSRRSLNSQDRASSTSSRNRREDLPVTVIPTPVRGGRTWSPDDLRDHEQEDPLRQDSTLTEVPSDPTDTLAIPNATSSNEQSVEAARPGPNRAESSSRIGGSEGRNSSNSQRQLGRFRAPTMGSLNDRLSSTSPGSAINGPSARIQTSSRQTMGSAARDGSNSGSPMNHSSSNADERASPGHGSQ